MADPILVKDGAIVTDNGRVVLGRCEKCCGGSVCWFRKYEPCADFEPTTQCPLPDPVFVTACWRCTTGSSRQVIFDDLGFCWFLADDPVLYLPNPGTGEDPPEGFEWIPEGATVWDAVEGPCATGCSDPACRSFEAFLPANRCPCTEVGPAVKYIRCSDLTRRTGCFVVKDPATGSCYEVDWSSPSASDPDPALIIGSGFGGPFDSCCECCDSIPGNPCTTGIRVFRNFDGCPHVVENVSGEVCCDDSGTVDIGYSVTLSYPLGSSCPPDVFEHWWTTAAINPNYWYRHTIHDGACTPTVTNYQDGSTSPVDCEDALTWRDFRDFGAPYVDATRMSQECFGDCAPLVRYRLRESLYAGTFSATTYQPDGFGGCALAWTESAAVIRTVATGTAGCKQCQRPTFGPAAPVVPTPPGGGNSPESLGFSVRWTQDRNGVMVPRITHPNLPRAVSSSPSNTLANNARPRGCANCGKDGGL